jgi:hypothetical protein
LAELGVEVERGTELLGFDETNGRVLAHLKRPDGTSEVREALEIGFPGGVSAHLFCEAAVEARGATMNGEVHVGLDTTDFLAEGA